MINKFYIARILSTGFTLANYTATTIKRNKWGIYRLYGSRLRKFPSHSPQIPHIIYIYSP